MYRISATYKDFKQTLHDSDTPYNAVIERFPIALYLNGSKYNNDIKYYVPELGTVSVRLVDGDYDHV